MKFIQIQGYTMTTKYINMDMIIVIITAHIERHTHSHTNERTWTRCLYSFEAQQYNE